MQKILIVEDDKKLRKELETFLTKHGFIAKGLEKFNNSIQDILNENADLILLDINLPYTDGEFVCKEVRKTSDVPIIMVTSRDNEIDELMSLNYGADQYVTKPYNIQILLAYGLPFLGITINSTIFLCISIIAIVLGIYSLIKIHSFKDYRKMYKQILTESNVYMQEKATGTQVMKDTSLKQIELDKNYISNKSGFAYFHDLFVKRHRKILTEAVKKQSVIILVIIIAMIIGITMNENFKTKTNEILLVYLPYFVFIMYLINRSSSVTQAMFMNCDHSMLTYRIYRTPKVILGIFKERLKTLITINLLPAVLIGGGLALLLYLSGGTDNPLNYAILFVSIISMSIFFSVHYLVMYYLLQPYNVSTEMKSSTYKVVQGLTYIVSWYMIQIKMPIFGFGIATIVFCIAYSLISLFLAYKYAPKTFKLRI